MRIDRAVIQNEIDFIFAGLVEKKIRSSVVNEVYNAFMEVLVDVINDDTDLEYPEKVYEHWHERVSGAQLYQYLNELTIRWLSKIVQHQTSEGYDKRTKFKLVKSKLNNVCSVDEIVIDLPYTLACFKEPVEEVENIAEINEENPDLEALNEYFSSYVENN